MKIMQKLFVWRYLVSLTLSGGQTGPPAMLETRLSPALGKCPAKEWQPSPGFLPAAPCRVSPGWATVWVQVASQTLYWTTQHQFRASFLLSSLWVTTGTTAILIFFKKRIVSSPCAHFLNLFLSELVIVRVSGCSISKPHMVKIALCTLPF